MPGPVAHTIIAEHLPRAFERRATEHDDVSDELLAVAEALRSNRRALVYGGQGPDPFFFNIDEMAPESLIDYYMNWADYRSRISRSFHELSEPLRIVQESISQKAEDAVLDAATHNDIIEQILELRAKFLEVKELASSVMKGFVKTLVLDRADPFGLFISPMQTSGKRLDSGSWKTTHTEWSWFDALHSRRTGDFVTELLDIAEGAEPGADGEQSRRDLLQSYTIGYLSHIAADVVGHAYVNTIVGGPYRLNQAQRHTTQEKIMDVWAYDYYYDNPDIDLDLRRLNQASDNGQLASERHYLDGELIDSGIHKNFLFTRGQVSSDGWQGGISTPVPQSGDAPVDAMLKLPEEIATNFSVAADRAYPTDEKEIFGELPPRASDVSYRFWYRFFRGSTETASPPHPSEVGEITLSEELKQGWSDFISELDDVPSAVDRLADDVSDLGDVFKSDAGGDGGGGGDCFQGEDFDAFVENTLDCLEDAAESALNYVSNTAEAVSNFFEEAAKMMDAVVALVEGDHPIPLRNLSFSLQEIYERLWTAYRNLLMLVTAVGFSYMYSDHLDQPQLRNMYDPGAEDALGNTVENLILNPDPGRDVTAFPRKGMKMGQEFNAEVGDVLQGLENEGHLVVPFTEVEEPRTIPGPDLYGEHTPELFITDPDEELESALGDGTPPLTDWIADPAENTSDPSEGGPTPSLSDFRGSDDASGGFADPVLGNAVDLTVRLYELYQGQVKGEQTREWGYVPNLNMSGDRGIGYPTWANKKPATTIDRERWSKWHGERVPWLRTPIDPVFVPKLRPKGDADTYY